VAHSCALAHLFGVGGFQIPLTTAGECPPVTAPTKPWADGAPTRPAEVSIGIPRPAAPHETLPTPYTPTTLFLSLWYPASFDVIYFLVHVEP
jgi:hypothetical protein